jgi:2-polyprenyl-6-methoxyphenol hydroxylase-like FAD-dependent oxidoreductase
VNRRPVRAASNGCAPPLSSEPAGARVTEETYDAVIVGARVAGATVGALLGDAAYRVLLVDRDTFPSSTLSTHYFRGGRAVSVLNRLGVLDDALGLGCPRLECEYRFRNGATEPIVSPAQQPGDVTFACPSAGRNWITS